MRAFSGGTVAGLPGIGNYEIVRVNDSASQSGKMNIKRLNVIEPNDIETSQDCFNSFKRCFRHLLKYPYSEVSAL